MASSRPEEFATLIDYRDRFHARTAKANQIRLNWEAANKIAVRLI
jgi:hypothetical protein